MFRKLEEIIKKLKGNVLAIGIADELLDKFTTNNSVNLYTIYAAKTTNIFSKQSKKNTNQGKIINIKKLRKYINKKSSQYIIMNMEEVIKYYKYIIKDTIYLNNNLIYIYSTNNIDKNFIINRYKRYNVEIEVTEYKNGYIIKIDNRHGKNSFIKDKMYFIKDTLYNAAEFIGNVLIS